MTLAVEELPTSIKTLHEHERILIDIQWKYRFFFKEILFLFSRDAQLEALYIKDNIANRVKIKQVMTNLIEHNEIAVPNEDALEFLVDSVLLSWQFYNSYLHTLGQEVDTCSAHKLIDYTNATMQAYIINK